MSLAQQNPDWQPKKRSRLGCNTCKARKVKCDEGQPVCNNCEGLHLECAYPSAGQRRVAVGRRNPKSCSGCRIARCKCSRKVVGQSSCDRCREKSLLCSYQDGPGNSPRQLLPSDPRGQGVVAAAPMQTTDIDEEACLTPAPEPAITQLHWLSSPDLPDGKHTRILVDSYFQNIHPLRCFSFIHKPSFLQKLAEVGSDVRSDALLHIMCTLGAQFFALEYSDTVQQLPASFILKAGSQWAAIAERLILGNTNQISIDGLMTTQLLHDYALRMGNFTQAFVLSALMARMTQALQINLEYSSDLFDEAATASLSVTARECRRRLMWSCYVTDVLCSNGVEQLTLIFEKDIKIQLPCNNRNFLHRQPSITRTLTGLPLDFAPPDKIPADLNSNMGMLGYLIQLLEIRRRVLWYIKHLDQAKLPWLLDSEFAQLDRELQAWYATLPANLQYTASTIYLRKESSQLGALCLFHCTYHQTMLDFYRIGTPELFKLRSAFHFPPEMSDFQRHLQYALFKEARTLGAIIAEAEQHSPRMIGDPWFPTMAYESNRVMLFYLTQVTDPVAVNKRDLVLSSIAYLQSNLKALKTMRATNAMAEGLSRGAESMLQKLGVDSNHILPLPNVILDDPYLAFPNRDAETPQRAADSDLHPLSIFRMARKEIPEGHVPVEPSKANSSSTSDVLQVIEDLIVGAAGMEGLSQKLDMFFTPDLARDWDVTEMILGSGTDDGPISWNGMTQTGPL
ncbi:fungal-specific transcription factor domain-containing protein [Ilyonectria robusta]|uniref:fungal-specific transcription factor domain-containing protein n=1 Tax=Ilyonectria robusta TaxID=1079257 RepID=UPI001E8EB285|nr:fungal-specific transcription factor domain-containing protein [Ilyonectria robusta]KAH8665477.1 fungal-specific transcription factor domain-containing protein [Ilyonectria robusta]